MVKDRQSRRYVGVSEAMKELFKTSYANRAIYDDRVKVLKGRQLMSQRRQDTLSVKMAGGGPALQSPEDCFCRRIQTAGRSELPELYPVCFAGKMRLAQTVFHLGIYDSYRDGDR